MDLLLLLLTAHFIGDFYLQSNQWVECRNVNHFKSSGLRKHLLVHILLYSIVFSLLDYSLSQATLSVVVISVSHFFIDSLKSHLKNNLSYFLLDQIIHIFVIILVWGYLSGFTADEIKDFCNHIVSPKNIIIAISYILVCKPASVIITLALKKHTDELKKRASNQTQQSIVEVNDTSSEKVTITINAKNNVNQQQQKNRDAEDIGLISAGAWIGYLERCLAISFIFMGQFSGIGFLVATKTIFRFGDLTKSKDMKLTEYMMLGTLLSYAIALFVGWNAMQIYRMI